ncbi:MAG: hypothetical protein U0798_20510 [Gemmataceae bacterium]
MTILECAVESYFGNAKDGAGIQRPRNLQTLVDRKILPSVSLRDPWGQPFQYDVKGPRNNGNRPDIWTVSKDRKTIIGNWKSKP